MSKDLVIREALTFDDVLLVPLYSEITPPEVTLESQFTSTIGVKIPVVSSAMDKVTEARTAIAMARAGGLGVIHRNLRPDLQALEVEKVKRSESGMIVDPVTLAPDKTVAEALDLMKEYGISGLPIVAEGSRALQGLVTNRDLRFEETMSRPISEVMTPKEKLVTGTESMDMAEAKRLMHKHRIEKLPVVDAQNNLVGLVTTKDIEKSISHPLANRDSKGRLRAGAAVGTGKDTKERVELLFNAGVDFVTVDTAHGDSKNVLDVVKWIKKTYPDLPVAAGNVATPEGARHLYEAGADAVKVGMGSGSICTTRVVAGIGIPQFTAVMDCAKVAREFKRTLIADGGIKYSGDAVKALAAGADVVMVGSLLAGTDEAPGAIVYNQGRTYKSYRGMGSIEAMRDGSRDRYGQESLDENSLVPEGIEGMVPYRGEMSQVLLQLVGGIKAGLGYLGCKDLVELRERAEFVKITGEGLRESHVHDVFVTKEAPNYRPTR